MINKLVILFGLFCVSLSAQPQLHTQTIIPGPTLNGPGAIFYLEDTPNGTDSVSWAAPPTLFGSVNYLWPDTSGFNDQPFCTSSTNATSWCSNVTIPSDAKYFIQDTAGTPVGMVWLDSSNLAWIGTLNAPITGGDVVLAWKGVGVAKLTQSANGNYVLGPDTDVTNTATVNTIGGRFAIWEDGWIANLKLGRPVTSGTGVVAGHLEIYSGLAPHLVGFIMRGAQRGLPGQPSASVTGNFVPETTNAWELGDDINNLLWKKISTVDLRIDGTCTGCGNIGSFTEGSILFADSSGNITEDNANLFWNDANKNLGLGTAAPHSATELHITNTKNSATQVWIENLDGAGTSVSALINFRSSAGRTRFTQFGPGNTTVRFGETVGSWGNLDHNLGSGLLIGTLNSTPIIFGTNNTEVFRIASGGISTFTGNIATGVDSTYSLFSAAVRPVVIYSDIINGRNIDIGPAVGTGAKEFQFSVPIVNQLFLTNSTGGNLTFWDSRIAGAFEMQIYTHTVSIDHNTPNVTVDLELHAGDDIDDLVRIRLLNQLENDGWNITFNQAGTADEFKIQDESGVDYFTISQDIGAHSFLQPIPNQTHFFNILAGDTIDDDVIIKIVDSGDVGYHVTWDQSAITLEFKDTASGEGFILSTSGAGSLNPLVNNAQLGTSVGPKRWDVFADDIDLLDDFTFGGTISGSGNIGMNWNPDGDSSRSLGNDTTQTWANLDVENIQIWTSTDIKRIELNNTIASFTQIRINNDAGTRRVDLGISANDGALSLIASSSSRNVSLSTITSFVGLTVGGDLVVSFRCSALAVDASDLATAITLINELKDCINENNHGLAAGT